MGTIVVDQIIDTIETAWQQRATLSPQNLAPGVREAIEHCIHGLDVGEYRVAEKHPDDGVDSWSVNEWLKKAVSLYFLIQDSQSIDASYTRFFDKIPLKYANHDTDAFQWSGTRVVPGALVRYGAFVAPDVILMPSFVNIGAYIDRGCMIDTWATVGSCAQIGRDVHLSGGSGIGGVLEPPQATPTIIEDNCFIGARSQIVEGVIVERGSVISMGVYIGQSTRIYNRETGESTYGRVPAGSVVVPGTLPAKDGTYSLYCAVIVKTVDEQTRAKTSLNELLRPLE